LRRLDAVEASAGGERRALGYLGGMELMMKTAAEYGLEILGSPRIPA
jgi:hypothetical protein